jgi:putative membrane protein
MDEPTMRPSSPSGSEEREVSEQLALTQDPAAVRTKLAAERTKLAKERTFAAWIRTALASAGIGVALTKLLPSAENKALVQSVGILFVTAAIFTFLFALKSYRDVVKRLEEHVKAAVPVWIAAVLTAVFVLGSIVGLISIVLDW